MLIRKSSKGHDLKLYRNTTPGATRTKKYPDGTTETLTYPSRYSYFLVYNGEVIKRSNSWDTIEEAYVDKCDDEHDGGAGRTWNDSSKPTNSGSQFMNATRPIVFIHRGFCCIIITPHAIGSRLIGFGGTYSSNVV